MANITVLGSGSWGCALAILARRANNNVRVWGFDKDQVDRINATRYNEGFLKDVKIPEEIFFTNNLTEALDKPDLVLVVVPAHAMRPVAKTLAQESFGLPLIINAAKGIENDSLRRMSEVLIDELPDKFADQVATLSGPSLAL